MAVQPGVTQSYAGLVLPLVYLADDMVKDVDPEVCSVGLRSTLLLLTVQALFFLAQIRLQNLFRKREFLSDCHCLLAPVPCT